MEPRVYVIARPTFDVTELHRFLEDEDTTWRSTNYSQPAEDLIEIAGRVCYMSFGNHQSPRDNGQYIKNLIAQGHESVLEHAVWSFLLADVSRSFTHQLVRHRVGFSYSQLSQQYHGEEDARSAMPAAVQNNAELAREWQNAVDVARQTYRTIVATLHTDGGIPAELSAKERNRLIRSAARGVLPGNTLTKIFVTANARALRHFFALRGGIEGDEEMRVVSTTIFDQVSKDAPALFSDFSLEQLTDGSPVLRHRNSTR